MLYESHEEDVAMDQTVIDARIAELRDKGWEWMSVGTTAASIKAGKVTLRFRKLIAFPVRPKAAP
jgi:hypothetical protein